MTEKRKEAGKEDNQVWGGALPGWPFFLTDHCLVSRATDCLLSKEGLLKAVWTTVSWSSLSRGRKRGDYLPAPISQDCVKSLPLDGYHPPLSWVIYVWAGPTVSHISLATRKSIVRVRGTQQGHAWIAGQWVVLPWSWLPPQLGPIKGQHLGDRWAKRIWYTNPSTINIFLSNLFLCKYILMVIIITEANAVFYQT